MAGHLNGDNVGGSDGADLLHKRSRSLAGAVAAFGNVVHHIDIDHRFLFAENFGVFHETFEKDLFGRTFARFENLERTFGDTLGTADALAGVNDRTFIGDGDSTGRTLLYATVATHARIGITARWESRCVLRHLATGGSEPHGNILDGAAETGRSMPLEVGIDDVGVVIGEMTSRLDLVEMFQPFGGIDQLVLRVKDIDGCERETVLLRQRDVRVGETALADVQHVGFHKSGMHLFDQRTEQFGVEEVLVALLAEVHLQPDLALLLHTERLIQFQDVFRRNILAKIDNRLIVSDLNLRFAVAGKTQKQSCQDDGQQGKSFLHKNSING